MAPFIGGANLLCANLLNANLCAPNYCAPIYAAPFNSMVGNLGDFIQTYLLYPRKLAGFFFLNLKQAAASCRDFTVVPYFLELMTPSIRSRSLL